jgi:hypothetical protein
MTTANTKTETKAKTETKIKTRDKELHLSDDVSDGRTV